MGYHRPARSRSGPKLVLSLVSLLVMFAAAWISRSFTILGK
jgi:hypothetical protein